VFSGAYEASVKGTGEGYIGCALNEGAAVGKEGDDVGRTLEPEEEIVKADIAVGCEAVAHLAEVHGAMVLMDLDGVAAAEGDVGAAFASEVGEDALTADRAGWVWPGGADFAAGAGPKIEG
jgi:hypothetical protein